MRHHDLLQNILSHWGIRLNRIHADINIAGSPERCELRYAVEDSNGRLFIIEKIFDEDLDHKLSIITALEHLHKEGLSAVNPYLKNIENAYITYYDDSYWQMAPFIQGTGLQRPEYVFDKWRGKALAAFLIELKAVSRHMPCFNKTNIFSIITFIYELVGAIRHHDDGLMKPIGPVLKFLETGFMDSHDTIPSAFCHGDFHPLNIIWSDNGINGVIDWEFLGYKPEIYDMANLIGCIGVEDPKGLAGDLIAEFVAEIKKAKIISAAGWKFLLEFIVAMRFAWLSEWLRHRDNDMIELEINYMNLLIDNRDRLQHIVQAA